jgi:integrase/recombinase XerC
MIDRYIEKFIRYLEIEKNYSSHTILNYKLDLSDFKIFLGEVDIAKVEYLLLRKYLAVLKEKKLGSRSVARHLSVLRSFFRFLNREGFLKSNPILSISSPKLEKHLPLFMTEEEVSKVLAVVSADNELGLRNRAILEIFYSTGMRISELAGLRASDIDLIGGGDQSVRQGQEGTAGSGRGYRAVRPAYIFGKTEKTVGYPVFE